jgi:hypothetical protein
MEIVKKKRGVVFIAPTRVDIPAGRMVDPTTSWFWVSWQDDEPIENEDVLGAEAAIAWGRERADRVAIRLGHTADTYFSAGIRPTGDPQWPPLRVPPEGWFTPRGDDWRVFS